MSTSTRLGALLIGVHLLFGALSLWLLRERPLLFVLVEVLLLLTLIGSLTLLRRLARPQKLLADAVDLLRAEDFATQLRPSGNDELDRLIEVYNRMAEQLRAARLRAAERDQLLLHIAEASPDAMVTLDHDDRIDRLNPTAERLLGIAESDARGRSLRELGSELGALMDSVQPTHSESFQLDGRRRLRVRRIPFLDRGFTRSFLVVDELSEELRRSEKAAYGKLIRMMAHEVNNTTGAVGSLLESCREYGRPLPAELREEFAAALDVAMRRIEHMNVFMRAFADVVRLGSPSPRELSLLPLLEDLKRLLRQELERRAIRIVGPTTDAGTIFADPVQLEQALLNILRNAMQAIDHGGTIELQLRREGPRIVLEIHDDGEGIDAEKARQLFTPFFTTRPDGQGIGLTLVREILLAHGCEFSLGPWEGRTRFRVEFPSGRRLPANGSG